MADAEAELPKVQTTANESRATVEEAKELLDIAESDEDRVPSRPTFDCVCVGKI